MNDYQTFAVGMLACAVAVLLLELWFISLRRRWKAQAWIDRNLGPLREKGR